MEKITKISKIKEPVRLRAKKLANGNRSLYLDTYRDGKRSYEFLRLYLVPEKTSADKIINAASLKAATAIKAERILAIVHGKANIKEPHSQMMLADWIAEIIDKKKGLRSKSIIVLMRRLSKHLEIHQSEVRLKDIDRGFCLGFADYLRSATALNSMKNLAEGTRYELLNALSVVLNEAVRAGLMADNPLSRLSAAERIKRPESSREYLTAEEVKDMISVSKHSTEKGDDVAAFLFCCFCGLRYSDVAALKWKNIIDSGNGKEIMITMKKTKRPISIPLSAQAIALLPPNRKPEDNVFAFPSYGVTLRRLKKSAVAAGIKKKVTFHVSRHTFATMMLTAGADLYTVSKLIGHTDIRTTQIYSKVIDRKKREAIALLDRFF